MNQGSQQFQLPSNSTGEQWSGEPSNGSPEKNLPEVRPQGGGLASQSAEDKANYLKTNLPMALPEDIERLSVVMNSECVESRSLGGKTLAVTGVVLYWGVHGEEENGEVIEGERANLLCDDGAVVSTTSRALIQSLRMALRCYGPGVWSPPVLIEIVTSKARRGTMLTGILRGRKGSKKK